MASLRSSSAALVVVLLNIFLIQACSNDQLPVDAELRISPGSRVVAITEVVNEQEQCIYDAFQFMDIPLLVSLRNGAGRALGDVEVEVYTDFAENTFGGFIHPLAIYKDRNGNGVIDSDSELVSGSEDGVARFRTDDDNGHVLVLLRANVSCGYRGQVFAYAGFASAIFDININASNELDSEEIAFH